MNNTVEASGEGICIPGCHYDNAMEKDLVIVSLFLFAVRLGGMFCERLNTSPIIGEVIVGAILGPTFLGFIGLPYSDGLKLVGLLGVQLAVIDAGIVTDMDKLRELAPRAMLIAVLGIILPIFIAVGVVMSFGGTFIEAFSTGAAIAPTSLGVVAKLLKEVGELDTPLGQIISMAAVFDDVLSLILLSFIEKLADESATTWQMVSPVVFAFVFIVGALLMSTMVPKVVIPAMEKIKSDIWKQYFSLFCLLVFALLLTFLANVAGTSFLLGGYLAGIAFASVGEVIPTVYEGQVKRLMLWTCRLFFAASIAFEIPVKSMFNADSLLLGLCLAIIAVFGKMLCGIGTFPNVKRDGPAVGVAMLGRGEFGFLIASKAFSLNLVNQSQYASAVWGVVVPTILTPILFAPVFRMRQKLVGNSDEPAENAKPMVNKDGYEKGNVEEPNVAIHTAEEHS